jgi:hypothetical protein
VADQLRLKRIVRLVFNRILINVTDMFLRVIGINRIDPLIRKSVVRPPRRISSSRPQTRGRCEREP